jgi:hypothetical protein
VADEMTSASNLRLVASASARRQGFARKAPRLTPALTATGATAQQVVKQLLDATASLIHHWLKHETTESATHQKIAQVVLANVDGEPVGPASSKPSASLGLASPLQRLGEDVRKSIKARQLLLPCLPTRPNIRTQPIQAIQQTGRTLH